MFHPRNNPLPAFPSRLRAALAAVAALAVLLAAAVDAHAAKRLGGGKSFGSKPAYERGYTAPAPSPNPDKAQRQAPPPAPAPAAPPAPPPSRWGGMGGLLGGLLLGGLVGPMIFGHGVAGSGMLDLLLASAVIYLLYRMVRSPREQALPVPMQQPPAPAPGQAPPAVGRPAGRTDGWEALRSAPAADRNGAAPQPTLPDGVDEEEFMAGAKALYTRLQRSWDRRDIDDIRRFATPEVAAEIARQAAEDPRPGNTEVLFVNARLLGVRRNGDETVATVLFDTLLREDGNAESPSQAREVWHFGRSESAPRPEWKLEGIQQLEV